MREKIDERILIGQKIGMLSVQTAWRKDGLIWVKCVCDCGKIKNLKWKSLKRLRHPSCSCINKKIKEQNKILYPCMLNKKNI